jgi:hypothetical protein
MPHPQTQAAWPVSSANPRKPRAAAVAVERVGLLIIIAISAWLRFLHLGARSLWVDEGASFAIARMDWWNFLRLLWRREANMALYYLFLRGWLAFSRVAAPSEAYLRALSVIFGVAAVVAIYFVGRKLWGAASGVSAAFLLAIHAYHIRYSQEARGYSLAVFLVLLSVFFLLRLQDETSNRDSRIYSAVSALAVYAHFYSFLVLVAEWIAIRFDPPLRAAAGRAIRRTLLLLIPAAAFIVFTGSGPLAWTHCPSPHELHVFAIYMSGGGTDALIWTYLFFAILGFLIALLTAPRGNRIFKPLLVLLWLALPIAVALAISFFKPVFANRFFVICVPALCLLVAGTAAQGAGKLRWLALPVAMVAGYLSFGAVQHFEAYGLDTPAEDWRAATHTVLMDSHATDGIVFYNSQGRMPFTYYEEREVQRGEIPGSSIPVTIFPGHEPGEISFRDFMGKPDQQQLSSASARFGRIWLVMCHNTIGDSYDEETRTLRATLSSHYTARQEFDFPGIRIELYSSTQM